MRSDGTNDERTPTPRVGCAPAGKVLASLGRFQREGLLAGEGWAAERWHRTARGAGSSEPDRTAGTHPPRSSGCRTRYHCRLIATGYATCRRLRFRVINPQVRPSFWRLQQPIRRLLLLAHPSDLELPGVDLLPQQGEANSLPLRVAPGRTDEHVDVGHAPPSLPSDPNWCYKLPGGTEGPALRAAADHGTRVTGDDELLHPPRRSRTSTAGSSASATTHTRAAPNAGESGRRAGPSPAATRSPYRPAARARRLPTSALHGLPARQSFVLAHVAVVAAERRGARPLHNNYSQARTVRNTPAAKADRAGGRIRGLGGLLRHGNPLSCSVAVELRRRVGCWVSGA